MVRLFACLAGFTLAACGQSGVNPPTEPARPVKATALTAAPAPVGPAGVGAIMPGAGPTNFMGRWAADVSWCPHTSGEQQPIEISTSRFEGYGNSCAIVRIDQVEDGYDAALACQAGGVTTQERVRMQVNDQTMRLTWLSRHGVILPLNRCTRLDDVTAKAPSLSIAKP